MFIKWLKKLLVVLLTLSLLLLILLLLLITPGQDEKPLISSSDVAQTRAWLSDTWQQLQQDKKPIAIEVSQQQLDAIMNVATYSIKPANFQGVINNFGVNLQASLDLTPYLTGKVIQASCLLLPSDNGLAFGQCRLGRIPVSGWLANHLFNFAVKAAISSPADRQLLALFARGEFSDNALYFINDEAVSLELKVNPQLLSLRQLTKDTFAAEPLPATEMQFYLQALAELNVAEPSERRTAYYLQQMLLIASERENNSSLQQEQTMALWVVIAAVGNPQFIRYANPELTPAQVPALPAMRLAGRQDLSLHFLYSAFFKLVGGKNISESIGNLKEIYDAGNGSGFSFIDLAADYAGIYFAEHLYSVNPHLLQTLSTAEFEAAIMPDITDLPEGLSEQQMQQQFGGYQGPAFKQTEQKILDRIQQLSLYQ